MNELVLTVGIPRSGKTTWARQQGCPVVNPDSIRRALHGQPFIGLSEPFVWAIAKVMVRALFLAGHDKVILDATNTTRKRRDEWISRSWVRHFVVFACSKELAVTRASRNECLTHEEREGLVEAIEQMYPPEDISPDELAEWELDSSYLSFCRDEAVIRPVEQAEGSCE